MESVYQTGNRSWVSEKICLKDLFREFSAAVPTVSNIESESAKSRKAVDLKKISVLMDVELSEDKLKILADTCSVDKLKVSCEPPTVDVECVKARPGLFDKSDIPPEASNLETLKHLKKRIINDETVEHLKYRSNIWLTEPSVENLDLTPGKHFLVTVRMYHPFRHKIGIRSSQPPRCSQEIVLLGEQFLTSLRDKILCPSDLAVSGELSENPHQSFTVRAMDIYKSGFIFIENTFYNDHRDPKNIDYSSVIRNWAASHDLGPFQTARMEDTKFEDLTVRLGYPYVYQHQGNCEHLLVFSDVRLLHPNDSLSCSDYPRYRSMSSANARYCMICGFYVARWITVENERVPHDPCFFCQHCFLSYNYVDGKKIGKFKAYPFYDKTAM